MNGGGDRLGGQEHNDILSVVPDSAEETARVVDELKRRGNAAFKVRSLREADILYSRAVEHAPQMAALWGNRSMTRLMMGQANEAEADAKKAIEADPAWVKGYFRLGQAQARLNQFDEAIQNFEKILEMEPKNKAVPPEIAKCKKEQVKYAEKRKAEEAKAREEAAKPRKIVSKRIVTDNSSSKGSSKPAAADKGGEVDMSMRGYRTLADGRKTTFFNMEQSEEDKELLAKSGEMQPRQIGEESEVAPINTKDAGSAWNAGNTFEEKDVNGWAIDRLKQIFKDMSIEASPEIDIIVTGIKDIEGDASIALTRGEKRHIFDFNFNVEWEAVIDDGEQRKAKGVLFYPEFNGDEAAAGAEFEVEIRWPGSNRDQVRAYEKAVLAGISLLRKEIQLGLETWVKDFHLIK